MEKAILNGKSWESACLLLEKKKWKWNGKRTAFHILLKDMKKLLSPEEFESDNAIWNKEKKKSEEQNKYFCNSKQTRDSSTNRSLFLNWNVQMTESVSRRLILHVQYENILWLLNKTLPLESQVLFIYLLIHSFIYLFIEMLYTSLEWSEICLS